jgi:Raf kinase inhibitor-like YbhB/YbcL family protein
MGLNIRDLRITRPGFASGSPLADSNSMDKGNVAPRLEVSGVPANAVELALVCHDPDAPLPQGYTHWVLYGIPPSTTALDAGSDRAFRAGPNSNGNQHYDGPAPPPGHGLHHYYFWIYALDRKVDGTPTREEFLAQYGPHILEQNRVIGTYER